MDSTAAVRRQVRVIQSLWGLSFGFYIFIFGFWFFRNYLDKFEDEGGALQFVFLLLIVRQAAIAVLEIPTGWLSDQYGRARMLRIAFAAKAAFHAGLWALPVPDSRAAFVGLGVALSLAFGIASSAFSGTFSRYVFDHFGDNTPEYRQTVASGHSYFFASELVAGVASALLLYYDLGAVAFGLGTAVCLAGLAYASAALADAPHVGPPIVGWRARLRMLGLVFRRLPANAALIVYFGTFLFLLNVVEASWPITVGVSFRKPEVPVAPWLILVSSVCVARLVGTRLVKRLQAGPDGPRWARRGLIYLGFAAGFGVIGLGTLNHLTGEAPLWALGPVVILVVLAHGFIAPAYDILQNYYLPAEFADTRATVVSLGSLFRSGLVVLLALATTTDTAQNVPSGWIAPAIAVVVTTVISVAAFRAAPGRP
jgi:MFS family permease